MEILDLCPSMLTLLNKAFRMALEEILHHSIESRGILGQGSKDARKQGCQEARKRKQESKQAGKQAGNH